MQLNLYAIEPINLQLASNKTTFKGKDRLLDTNNIQSVKFDRMIGQSISLKIQGLCPAHIILFRNTSTGFFSRYIY